MSTGSGGANRLGDGDGHRHGGGTVIVIVIEMLIVVVAEQYLKPLNLKHKPAPKGQPLHQLQRFQEMHAASSGM